MIVDVNDPYAHDLQSMFIIPGTSGPEAANPRGLVAGLGNMGGVNGDSLSLSGKMLTDNCAVEREPVESLVLKKVPVCLLRETSIPAQLKEIDTIRYGGCVKTHFLKM